MYGSFVAVSLLPETALTAFHMLATLWPPDQVQPTDQPAVVLVVLVLVTVTVTLKPPPQLLSMCQLAEQPEAVALAVVAETAVDFAEKLAAASKARTW